MSKGNDLRRMASKVKNKMMKSMKEYGNKAADDMVDPMTKKEWQSKMNSCSTEDMD